MTYRVIESPLQFLCIFRNINHAKPNIQITRLAVLKHCPPLHIQALPRNRQD